MNKKNRMAIVVDAYGAGKHLAEYFIKKNILCVHLQSTQHRLTALTPFDESNYLTSIVHNNILATKKTINTLLNKHNSTLICIIPGVEPGVFLADKLSEIFNLPTNGISLSNARRNKYWMDVALQNAGLTTPKYYKSAHLQKILNWIKMNTSWPIILKPLTSAGTNNVYLCNNENEVKIAFNTTLGNLNNMGLINKEVLIQSYLDGEEYIVNTVSYKNKVVLTDLWHAHKKMIKGHSVLYDYEKLLPSTGELQTKLITCVEQVLHALKIQYGPAHAEIRVVKGQPILVEIGARISGVANPHVLDKCIGYNQAQLTVEAYTNPKNFCRYTKEKYKLQYNVLEIILTSKKDACFYPHIFLSQIANLNTVYEIKLKYNTSTHIKSSYDLCTILGIIYLVHKDKALIKNEYLQVQNALDNSLY